MTDTILVLRVAARFQRADLAPPLGYPGGPCYVVQRINEEVQNPRLKDQLIDKAEHGQKITNPEAAKIYDLEAERGEGLIKRLLIGPHAQYRMDLRQVTVPQVRVALRDFSKMLNDLKSQRSSKYNYYAQLVARGEPIEYTHPRLNLTVVFAITGQGQAKLVTTYWKGEPDPPAPRHCEIPKTAAVPDLDRPSLNGAVKKIDNLRKAMMRVNSKHMKPPEYNYDDPDKALAELKKRAVEVQSLAKDAEAKLKRFNTEFQSADKWVGRSHAALGKYLERVEENLDRLEKLIHDPIAFSTHALNSFGMPADTPESAGTHFEYITKGLWQQLRGAVTVAETIQVKQQQIER